MLPGLTADHHLFDGQVEHFRGKANLLVWDAPGHGVSRPWAGDLALDNQARLLRQILESEGIERPVLIGQSMGGYVSQAFLQLFPDDALGFVSIDSAPLKKQYYAGWETASLKHMLSMYKCIPWNMLVKWTATGCSETPEGKQYMLDLANNYGRKTFQELSSEGYKQLALAIESDKLYDIPCPLLVLCGEKDAAGFTKKYNEDWQRRESVNLVWVPEAGHNSNMDAPDFVNAQIDSFLATLDKCKV